MVDHFFSCMPLLSKTRHKKHRSEAPFVFSPVCMHRFFAQFFLFQCIMLNYFMMVHSCRFLVAVPSLLVRSLLTNSVSVDFLRPSVAMFVLLNQFSASTFCLPSFSACLCVFFYPVPVFARRIFSYPYDYFFLLL